MFEPATSIVPHGLAWMVAVFLAELQQGTIVTVFPALAFGILGVMFRRGQTPVIFTFLLGCGLVATASTISI